MHLYARKGPARGEPAKSSRSLKVSAPGDRFEQEADRIADQVMRSGPSSVRRTCSCGGECPECSKTPEQVQTKRTPGGAGEVDAPADVRGALRSPGRPLDPSTRAFMEDRFGHDFGRVRIHADERSGALARDLGAAAFTVGNRIAFPAGVDHASPSQRHLLAHELAHVVQQGAARPLGAESPAVSRTGEPQLQLRRLLVHGSGFPRPFTSDPEELRCGKDRLVRGNPDCHWSPSSVDMKVLGTGSGGSQGVATLEELASFIERQGTGTIDELGIIGHSNHKWFAIGGTIDHDGVTFSEPSMMGPTASFEAVRPRLEAARDRFVPHARIVLMGCGAGGAGGDLLDYLSKVFARCVAGFQEPIQYAINGTTSGPVVNVNGKDERRIDNDATITERGRVSYSNAMRNLEIFDPSVLLGSMDAFRTNAWDLQTDAESCAGVAILRAAGRINRPGSYAMTTASEVGWRILQEYYPAKAGLVAGIGYDETAAGLKVRFDLKEGKTFIDVGKAYVEQTNSRTLAQRAKEMEQALEAVKKGPSEEALAEAKKTKKDPFDLIPMQ